MKTIALQLAFLTVAAPALAMSGQEFSGAGIADPVSFIDGISQALASNDPSFHACLQGLPEPWEQGAIAAIRALPEFDVVQTTEIYARSECRRRGMKPG